MIAIRALVSTIRQSLGDVAAIARLRRRNPGARIGHRVKVLGCADELSLGHDCEIDDGVILDFRYGGSIVLGNRVSVRSGAILSPYGGHIQMDDDCGVNHYSILYGHGGLTVGKIVRFAAHCLVIPANHSFDDLSMPISNQPLTAQGIKVGNDVWVGGHCTILDGVTIGDGAVLAAGSVVSKDVDARSVNAGIPARKLRTR